MHRLVCQEHLRVISIVSSRRHGWARSARAPSDGCEVRKNTLSRGWPVRAPRQKISERRERIGGGQGLSEDRAQPAKGGGPSVDLPETEREPCCKLGLEPLFFHKDFSTPRHGVSLYIIPDWSRHTSAKAIAPIWGVTTPTRRPAGG